MRVTHFAIPSAKYFAPFSPIFLSLILKFKEVRVTHFAICSPNSFAPLSPYRYSCFVKSIESIN